MVLVQEEPKGSDRERGRGAPACYLALCTAGSVWIAVYIGCRTVQPYHLDAFEEYECFKAMRFGQGIPLYGDPGREMLPTAYPPLHYWLLAGWLRIFGVSFVTPRLLSLAATAGTVVAGLAAVRWALAPRDAGAGRLAQLVGAVGFVTVFLAFYRLTGKWFELCKADSLLVCFLAVGLAAGGHRSWKQAAISTAGFWLAALTKQNAPLFVLPVCMAHVLHGRWRWALGWGATTGALIAGSYGVLGLFSGGKFFYWVFEWPAGHGIDVRGGAVRTFESITECAPILYVLVPLELWRRPRSRWTWSLAAGVAVGWMGLSKNGGLENHLYPLAFVAAVVVGQWLGACWEFAWPVGGGAERSGNRPQPVHPGNRARRAERLLRWAPPVLIALILYPAVPRKREFRWLAKRAAEADAWIEAVQALPGRVAVGHHFLLARRAGAEAFFSGVIFTFPNLQVPPELARAIERRRYDYLLLRSNAEESTTRDWATVVSTHYSAAGPLEFRNVSGVLPRRLYSPRVDSVATQATPKRQGASRASM